MRNDIAKHMLMVAAENVSLRLNEVYLSIQGETRDVGCPTIFVRTQGCSLKCFWCDTKDSLSKDGGEELKVIDVYNKIVDLTGGLTSIKICITGGEPLEQFQGLFILCGLLKENGYYVTVETNGNQPISFIQRCVDSIVMDWKCPSSKMASTMDEGNLVYLWPKDQLKIIVASEEDMQEAERIIKKCKEIRQNTPEILVGIVEGMPCGLSKQDVIDRMLGWKKLYNIKIRFQIQLHKYVYGNKRGV